MEEITAGDVNYPRIFSSWVVHRDMMLSISKAKQLLTDNTQDNEKETTR